MSNLESDMPNGGWKYLLSDAFVVVMMSSFSVMFFEVCFYRDALSKMTKYMRGSKHLQLTYFLYHFSLRWRPC